MSSNILHFLVLQFASSPKPLFTFSFLLICCRNYQSFLFAGLFGDSLVLDVLQYYLSWEKIALVFYVLRNFLSFLNSACITKEVTKTDLESVFTLLESATSEYYVWLYAGPKNSKVLKVKVYTQLCFCYFSCQGLFWKYNQLPKNETSAMWLLS